LSKLRVMFLASKIALQVSAAVIKKKAILQVIAVRESKGILLALAEFVRRLQIRISCFLLMFATRLAFKFSRFVNKRL
jgi:hypothetical protein